MDVFVIDYGGGPVADADLWRTTCADCSLYVCLGLAISLDS